MNPWNDFIKQLNVLLKQNKPNFNQWKPIKQAINPNPSLHKKLLASFEQSTIQIDNVSHIFEFGAGIGSLAQQIQPFNGSYTIFDFPQMIAIQAFNLYQYNINYISDINSLPIPKTNSLFITSSALEETPEQMFSFFLNYAKSFSFFLFKYSGGKSKFQEFAENFTITINEKFNKNTYILAGIIP